MQHIFKTGLLLIILGLGLWLYKNEMNNVLPISDDLDHYVFMSGVALSGFCLLIGFFSKISDSTLLGAPKNKCVRCGIKIPKGEMYCEFHRREVTKEYEKNTSENNRE